MHASKMGFTAIVELLLQAGADVNLKNEVLVSCNCMYVCVYVCTALQHPSSPPTRELFAYLFLFSPEHLSPSSFWCRVAAQLSLWPRFMATPKLPSSS